MNSNISMLTNHVRSQQKRHAEAFNQKYSAKDVKVQLTETSIYIGLNSTRTKQKKYEPEQYTGILKNYCKTHNLSFSMSIEERGYFLENGEFTEEPTMVITLIDTDKQHIPKIAKDLGNLFNQDSVLISENEVRGCLIMIE